MAESIKPSLSPASRPLTWIVATALFMQTLDVTILNTALPAIATALNQSPLNMQLTVICYALTIALLTPLSGWLADKYGTLTIFRYAVAWFTFGSFCCAISPTLNSLIVARIIQGIGGSMMMPVARLTLIKATPKAQILSAWNLMAMAGLTGPILGPVFGGWFVTYASWHWIFLINIPIGICGLYFSGKYIPNFSAKPNRLDRTGFLLFASGLVSLTLGLEYFSNQHQSNFIASLILLTGLILLYAYYQHALRVNTPLFPLSVFHNRLFRIGIIANIFIRLSASGIPFLLPLMLQVALGYSADTTGIMMIPLALGSIMAKPFISKILAYFGYKITLLGTTLFMVLSIAALGFLSHDFSLWVTALIIFNYGCCMSVIFTSINTLMISDLNEQQLSIGNTLLSVIQQIGISLGIAVVSVLLSFFTHLNSNSASLHTVFSYSIFSIAFLGILTLPVLLKIKRHDGENIQMPIQKKSKC
ncbi:MFS transporter [Mergibacter septicus]|uniref:MFS transporter n=1 Tax=Mergibacter septicus TaxID=221402 RepID=A0A8E3S967_9PAST|nr:DHA2 family efflux MFS transporter permease subunit [Mergibacter septicus]AWX16246.1 MFS transporter [Mergibacter septicus]QDJ15498.1 MFS transporter [Mergibacter septicus]UTU48633.1 DHA2 family efflux MFS transporter permease subunit [Mergibacter septicus]WMR95737.1 DHA2 family efflux MFS transporter permease subunit [Mergibacter septicus]